MSDKPIIIGISGASASGKSLLANTIVNELGSKHVVVISEDSYYKDNHHLSFEERSRINFDHPDSLDHALLIDHLAKLRNNEAIEVPCYDFASHQRLETTTVVSNHRIIVLEGILLLFDQCLRDLMDIRLFMDTPLDICLLRRIKRDVLERQRSFDSVLEQYSRTVRPMYLQFIEPSKRYADIIIPRGGENRIAIDLIKAKIKELLQHENN